MMHSVALVAPGLKIWANISAQVSLVFGAEILDDLTSGPIAEVGQWSAGVGVAYFAFRLLRAAYSDSIEMRSEAAQIQSELVAAERIAHTAEIERYQARISQLEARLDGRETSG